MAKCRLRSGCCSRHLAALGLLLAWLCILPTAMAAGKHAQHGGPAQAGPCDDIEAPPTLRCALAPAAAFDGDGRLWLAWVSRGHVYLNYSDDGATQFSEPLAVNRMPERIAADGENRPKLAVGPDGAIYIAWTVRLAKPYTGNVRFSVSHDGGRSFSEPLTVNDDRHITSHRFEALAVNDNGDIYLVWLDKRDRVAAAQKGEKYRGAALYYTLSTDGGRSFAANRKVIDHTCECCRVAIDIDRDQLPVVAWRHIYGDNIRDHAWFKFRAAGQAGTPVRLSHDNWQVEACPHHGPAISVGGQGHYHAVWFNNAPERHGLFYARSSDGGRSFSPPLAFGNYQAGASHPDVLVRGDEVYLVWKEFNGSETVLYLQRSSDGGRSWASARAVTTSAGASDHPFLLNGPDGVYVQWHTQDEGLFLRPLTTVAEAG